MEPMIAVVTLGVEDLDRSVRFYRDGLGLPTKGIVGKEFEHGAVAFFDLDSGLKLAVWPRDSIAYDTGLAKAPLPCPTNFTLGHNVRRKEQVDEVMEIARLAGATVLKEPRDTFWGGYAGYFQDPDGHVWELVWNPELIP